MRNRIAWEWPTKTRLYHVLVLSYVSRFAFDTLHSAMERASKDPFGERPKCPLRRSPLVARHGCTTVWRMSVMAMVDKYLEILLVVQGPDLQLSSDPRQVSRSMTSKYEVFFTMAGTWVTLATKPKPIIFRGTCALSALLLTLLGEVLQPREK